MLKSDQLKNKSLSILQFNKSHFEELFFLIPLRFQDDFLSSRKPVFMVMRGRKAGVSACAST